MELLLYGEVLHRAEQQAELRQKLDGLHHYFVLDQGDDFAGFLQAAGARTLRRMPVSLDRAVNAFLARNHASPNRSVP